MPFFLRHSQQTKRRASMMLELVTLAKCPGPIAAEAMGLNIKYLSGLKI
jgi:hypothetical protein